MKKIILIIMIIFSYQIKTECFYSAKLYVTYTNKYPCPQFKLWDNGTPKKGWAFCKGNVPLTTKTAGLTSSDVHSFKYNNQYLSFRKIGLVNTKWSTSQNHETQYKTENRYAICFN
jgi:hypothetical protein